MEHKHKAKIISTAIIIVAVLTIILFKLTGCTKTDDSIKSERPKISAPAAVNESDCKDEAGDTSSCEVL